MLKRKSVSSSTYRQLACKFGRTRNKLPEAGTLWQESCHLCEIDDEGCSGDEQSEPHMSQQASADNNVEAIEGKDEVATHTGKGKKEARHDHGPVDVGDTDALLSFLLQTAPDVNASTDSIGSIASTSGALLPQSLLRKRQHFIRHRSPGKTSPQRSSRPSYVPIRRIDHAYRKPQRGKEMGNAVMLGEQNMVRPPPPVVRRQAGGAENGAKRTYAPAQRSILPKKPPSLVLRRPPTPKGPPVPPPSTAVSEIGDETPARLRLEDLHFMPDAGLPPSCSKEEPEEGSTPRLPPITLPAGTSTNAFFPEERWDLGVAKQQLLDRAVVCCDRNFNHMTGVSLEEPSPRGRRLRRVDGATFDVWTDETYAAFYSVGLHRPDRSPRMPPITITPRARSINESEKSSQLLLPALAVSAPMPKI